VLAPKREIAYFKACDLFVKPLFGAR